LGRRYGASLKKRTALL